MDLPRYQSHKTVGALQIAAVEGTVIMFADKGFPSISVDPSMFARFTPTAGDYYVVYDDGYASFSPRKAFEEGYAPITLLARLTAEESNAKRDERAAQSAQAGYSTAGMLAAILLCAVCVTSFAKGHGNPAALAKYRAEKAAGTVPTKTYTVPSAGKWSKPAAAPVSGK